MHQQIAKIAHTYLGAGERSRGIFTAELTVDFGGSGRGIGGYPLGADTGFAAGFIQGILGAAGADSWEQLVGRTILVLTESDDWDAPVLGIAPLPTEKGTAFLFADLIEKHRR